MSEDNYIERGLRNARIKIPDFRSWVPLIGPQPDFVCPWTGRSLTRRMTPEEKEEERQLIEKNKRKRLEEENRKDLEEKNRQQALNSDAGPSQPVTLPAKVSKSRRQTIA